MGHRELGGLSRRVKYYERKRQALKIRPPGRPRKNPQPPEKVYCILSDVHVAYLPMVYNAV